MSESPDRADGLRPRRVAFDLLMAVATEDAYANLTLPTLITRAGLDTRDAALATELGYGALRWQGVLDEVIRRCASRDDLDDGVLAVLRLGAYQLLATRIPPHAAVATSVDLVRRTGAPRAAGFVNAILRKVGAATMEEWVEVIAGGADDLGRLSVMTAHPRWIVQAFADALSGDLIEVEHALRADDERPVTHLVGWPGRVSRDALLAEAGGEPGPYSPYAVRMAGGRPGDVPAVSTHRAAVQDEGSQLCALALTRLPLSGPDERWLDLCAGPGGKAALLGALAAERGAQVIANELHPHRAELVARTVNGFPVSVQVGDARAMSPADPGFDRILLDAPCTGLGALRRRPEARWRRSGAELADLLPLQADLLDAAVAQLRPGGVLCYVTCSPHPAETREQVEGVLARHTDLRPLELGEAMPGLAPVRAESVQLWPHRQGTDAMFLAAFSRAG